jgi:hypothetical protein
LNTSDAQVTTKVEELLLALDQVKKYRALSRLMVDFGIIMLASITLLISSELAVNIYRLTGGFPCYYAGPGLFTCTYLLAISPVSPLVQLLAGISQLLIPAAGLLLGIVWVDRKLRSYKGGQWKETLKEGFPGALKVLQSLDWDSVFDDMRVSKIGYSVYFAIKVLGYWMLTFIVLFFPYALAVSGLHAEANFYILGLVSFVLVLVLTRRDLQRRYGQVVSLDTLMWELRWFSNEFRSAEFKA